MQTVQAGMLAGRVALVTGAGRGLGASYALALAGAGATVVVNDSGVDLGGANPDPAVAGAVADEIRRAGGKAVADSTDVGSFATAAQVVGRAIEECGRIDILVNNAGIIGSARVSDVDEQEFDALMAVHVTGTVGTIRAAFPHMRSQRHGRIVNVTSEAALSREHGPGMAYAAAKAAIWGVTMAAATEGAEFGVTVNALSPGALTRMSQTHLDRTGIPDGLDLSPARVAEVLLLLCADAAGEINGRVVHTAAGYIREYVLARTHDSDLVRLLEAARSACPSRLTHPSVQSIAAEEIST